MIVLLKRHNNFGDNKVKKKKNPTPLPSQKSAYLRKNHKKVRFSNFRLKKTQLNAQKLTHRDFEPMK